MRTWRYNVSLIPNVSNSKKPRVCAVSYLNTVPLVWGMLRGPQQNVFDVAFAVPSACADKVRSGEADIGIIPAVELLRQNVGIFRGAGIACHGPVRSILLISKVPYPEIRRLATDSGSRTSAALSRIILAERYGARPLVFSLPPALDTMLETADAALLIGDSALRVDIERTPYRVLDLGAEWTQMTGLPMVFAVWAGRAELVIPEYEKTFIESCRYGLAHVDEIVRTEHERRGITAELAREYLTRNIVFELGERDYQGLDLYLQYARKIEREGVSA